MAMPPKTRLNVPSRLALGGLFVALAIAAYPLAGHAGAVRGRWLQLQWFSGRVTTQLENSRLARVGDRLAAVGHGVTTARQASANLAIDTGIGSVAMAQSTQMTVQRLDVLPDGARITILTVSRGQARLQARPLTNPNSRLELHTPSGVAAVRGTDFGVSVSEDKKTSVATLEGRVEAIAQSVKVPVDPGLVSIIYPGEPPLSPQPLDRDLDIEWQTRERGDSRLSVSGFINAANTLYLDGEEVPINRTGYFEIVVPLAISLRSVTFTVQNPVGEFREHLILPWKLPNRRGNDLT